MTDNHRRADEHWFLCTCGKHAFVSRRAAKRHARTLGHGSLGVYPCKILAAERPDAAPVYHVGHKPDALRRGRVSRRGIVQLPRGKRDTNPDPTVQIAERKQLL